MSQFVPFHARIRVISHAKTRQITRQTATNHFTFNYQQHHRLQLILKQPPPFPWLTTPLPLRGGAGGEALFPFLYSAKGPGVRLCLYAKFLSIIALCALIKGEMEDNMNSISVRFVIFLWHNMLLKA